MSPTDQPAANDAAALAAPSAPAATPRTTASIADAVTAAKAALPPSRATPPLPRVPRWWYAALFLLGCAIYGAVAANRLTHTSSAPHFVYQADAWLHGHLAVTGPITGDDWAKLETVELDNQQRVQGRRLQTRPFFRTTAGGEISTARIVATRGYTQHMSFPAMPAVLMLPLVAISGRTANDTAFTVLLAALILPLTFATLRRLRHAGLSERSTPDDLWLTLTLAFGTVLFFAAVQGKVWFTAHVVGVCFALLYALASIDAARPWLAGLALGCAATTRTPMAFMFPLFLYELWRIHGGRAAWRQDARAMVRTALPVLVKFALPVITLAAVAGAYNYLRFHSFTEFGHTYLEVRQQAQIERWGLFNFHYLARNLAVAFTLLPEFGQPHAPLQIGGHGLALWFTTPLFVFLLWPKQVSEMSRGLWLTVALVALPTLFYQNSGWWQFGYRFSLDYTVFLIMLLAVGARPLRRVGKALIVFGIMVNLFGALTFDRHYKFYRLGGNAYDVVVPH